MRSRTVHVGLNTPADTGTAQATLPWTITKDGTAQAIPNNEEKIMLRWAAIFLIIAIIAALFGFGGIAGAAAGIAQTLFFIFIAICVILFLAGLFTGRSV